MPQVKIRESALFWGLMSLTSLRFFFVRATTLQVVEHSTSHNARSQFLPEIQECPTCHVLRYGTVPVVSSYCFCSIIHLDPAAWRKLQIQNSLQKVEPPIV